MNSNPKKRIFMDCAGTTPVHDDVLKCIMEQYNIEDPRDTSVIEKAKSMLATHIGADLHEIAFTSCGSYSNNLAIRHIVEKNKEKGRHVIYSSIEHPSVINTMKALAKEGYETEALPVDFTGVVSVEALKNRLRDDTVLVAVMFYNNETGVRQPVEAIGALLEEKGIDFHVDAVQALGKTKINVNATSMSFSAHKILGPKGCGAIYFRGGVPFNEIELSKDTPLISGFMKAIEHAYDRLDDNLIRFHRLMTRLTEGLTKADYGNRIVGERNLAHPCILNVNFADRDGDGLVIQYDWEGVAVSSGSACSSGAMSASSVLLAMGMNEEEAKRSVRFSICEMTTESDIEAVIMATERILKYGKE